MSAPRSAKVWSVAAAVTAGMTLLAGCASPESAAPPSPSAPQALRAAAAALLSPPSFDSAAPSADDAPGTDPESLLPGLYALDRLAADVNGATVTIRAQRPCSEVLDELQAGQWAARVIPATDSPLSSTMVVLSYGEHLAIAYLKDGESSCVGSVTAGSDVDITGGGALAATGAAVELPLYCHVGPDLNGQDLKDLRLSYFGLFATAGDPFVIMVSAPAQVGTQQLTMDEEGGQGITVLPLKKDVAPIDAAVTFLSTFFAGQGSPDDAFAQFTGMFYGGGTLKVTSTDPLEATLTTDALAAYDESADDDDDSDEGDDGSAYDSDGNPIESSDDSDQDDDSGVMQEIGGAAGQSLTLTTPLHCGQ